MNLVAIMDTTFAKPMPNIQHSPRITITFPHNSVCLLSNFFYAFARFVNSSTNTFTNLASIMNLGNLGNLNIGNMMEQMKKLQEDVARTQAELARKTVTAETGAGMVRVVVNGKLELLSLHIDPSILNDAQMVQDLVLAAVNKGLNDARELGEQEMQKVSGLFPTIPGMDFLK
jgi:nucleoid-associated protein EbfC